jgi:uncharacterized membrane protein
MNKMLVAVFENEIAAFEGLSALKDLHQNGDITLYATAVLSKNADGQLQLKSAADRGAVGSATGLLAGSLIGLIGGPVGMAIGAASGYFAGLLFDVSADGVNFKFLDEVSAALTKGKSAIVAEVDENWTVPVDSRLSNAMVFRRLRDEVAEAQLARESKAIADEFKRLKEELKEAGEERKAQIQSALTKLVTKAQAVSDQLNRKLQETKGEMEAKVNAIQTQMKDAKVRRKEKMEKRIEEIKTDYAVRVGKLKQAGKLINEAFAPKEEEHLV